jgi:hypothetical protein
MLYYMTLESGFLIHILRSLSESIEFFRIVLPFKVEFDATFLWGDFMFFLCISNRVLIASM